MCSEGVPEKWMVCDMMVSEGNFPQTINVMWVAVGNECINLINVHVLHTRGVVCIMWRTGRQKHDLQDCQVGRS